MATILSFVTFARFSWAETQQLKVHLAWGHRSSIVQPFHLSFQTNQILITEFRPVDFEPGDLLQNERCETRAGAGDVDGVELTLAFPQQNVSPLSNVQPIWNYLFARSDSEAANRWRLDAGLRPDPRKLTIQLSPDGTHGFSLTVDQLLMNKVFWVPELDIFLSAGEAPVSFDEYQQQLKPWAGRRVLEQLERQPEATYEQYASSWEDMGDAAYTNSAASSPGHIICVTWDSAIPKFGLDRWAGVWNDYGNPDHFRFGFNFGQPPGDPVGSWKSQKLTRGLPVVISTFERGGVRYEVEQFAYPLHGPPAERRGDIQMVLLQKVRLTELTGKAQAVSLAMTQKRELGPGAAAFVRTNGSTLVWEQRDTGSLLLAIDAPEFTLLSNMFSGTNWVTNDMVLTGSLPPKGAREFVVKLPSSLVAKPDSSALFRLDYLACRASTLKFWSEYLNRGAQFNVPEQTVNDLFRANLWHALRLPRRHGGTSETPKIDLPYSNFAYDQNGTPWPINQAVYVDYMLYDLRGYHSIAAEELEAMYANNQEPNGHVGGFANWGVYTPGMIYATAQHFLLSGERSRMEPLMSEALKAFNWCQTEVRQGSAQNGPTVGLMLAPLNDLSHDQKAWAFNQAYLYAGPELLGRMLTALHDSRAQECFGFAQTMRLSVRRAFACAATQSPLVQLRDHTWIPYVPSDALTPMRLLEVWYPTDVDCGALHLARLQAIDPNGSLTTDLLNDAEDNLFLHGWGMANEPVYNPQATAYLLRDQVKPAIRAFYSMMACAFSHSTFEPVEHRWGWGQYFGPPSTDGAWFELYRHMLIRERPDNTLLLCQATPRKWLESGKEIKIERAPTYYGLLSLTLNSRNHANVISTSLDLQMRHRPGALFLRLRHPYNRPIKSVSLNGRGWSDFDCAKEWIRIPEPSQNHYQIETRYQ